MKNPLSRQVCSEPILGMERQRLAVDCCLGPP
jgi:hypothetical protein